MKFTYEKPDADVLIEHMLGPHDQTGIFQDSRVLSIEIFRSADRSFGTQFIAWENEDSYTQWRNDHNEAIVGYNKDITEYYKQMNIEYNEYHPPSVGFDWTDPEYSGFPKIDLDSKITYNQIFE
jgi:hypothetical protein